MSTRSEFEQKILEHLEQAYGARSEDQIVAAAGGGNPYNEYRVRQTVWELVSEGRFRQVGPHMYEKVVPKSSKPQIKERQSVLDYYVVRIDKLHSIVRLYVMSGPHETRDKAEEMLRFAISRQPGETWEIWSRSELIRASSSGINVDTPYPL